MDGEFGTSPGLVLVLEIEGLASGMTKVKDFDLIVLVVQAVMNIDSRMN